MGRFRVFPFYDPVWKSLSILTKGGHAYLAVNTQVIPDHSLYEQILVQVVDDWGMYPF